MLKEEAEEGEKESAHNLKSTLLISGAVVAVVGAIFAIAKKIKEANWRLQFATNSNSFWCLLCLKSINNVLLDLGHVYEIPTTNYIMH